MKKYYVGLILILLITGWHFNVAAQNQSPMTVKGKVSSLSGPLPGVSILVKGTQTGTSTGANGEYAIQLNDSTAILVFSYVGYVTEEVAVKGRTVLDDMLLIEDISTLSEIVVVGYGTKIRKDLASTITKVNPEDMNRGAITDVGQLLQGKVPGLNITLSGDPNTKAAIVLRGASTINSPGGPLFVIDGVVGADISIVAPDDIASIDVLRDAAATAIYGNRASNGVIIISTKRGKKGESQVTYSSYVGVEKVTSKLKMMTSTQLRDFLSANSVAFAPVDDKGANTDWQQAIEKKSAISQNHNLSFSGGTEHNTYSASVNYAYKDGILPKSSLNRFIARLAMDQYALNDKVRFGFNLNYSNNIANNTPLRNTVLQQMIQHLPVSPVKNPNGTYFENVKTGSYYNPVAIVDNGKDETKYTTLVGAFTTHVNLPFGLTYDLNLSYQNENSLHGEAYGSYYSQIYGGNFYNNPDPPLTKNLLSLGTNGTALRNTYQNTKKIIESFVTWDKDFGNHGINAVLGYAYQSSDIGDGFQATTTNLAVDNVGYSNFALSNPYAVNGYKINFGNDYAYYKTKLISDFFRLNYNYKDKYLFQGSVRRDGSSVFGDKQKWGYFPSVGVAWRVIEEAFMKGLKTISDLKIRGSYGVSGNASGFNAYSAKYTMGSQGTYYYNDNQMAAYGSTQLANPDLHWEKTTTTDVGVDFGVLQNRISGSVDWYDKNTSDMIYVYAVDPILVPSGFLVANSGGIKNRGIEIALSATPVKFNELRWTTSLNFAHNVNTITGLTNSLIVGGDSIQYSQPDGIGQTASTLQILKVGKPIGQFFTLQYAGKNDQGISQYIDKDGALTTSPAIGTDYHYVGSPHPKLLMGWTNTVVYNRFTLNFFFRGVFGNKIFNVTRADLFRPSTAQYTNILADVSGESIYDVNAYKYSTRFIEDGSYVRLDNATLAYNFKLSSQYVKTFRLYVTVNNAFIITRYKGIDPEVNQGGIALGVDSNNFYPKTRTFLVGFNVSF